MLKKWTGLVVAMACVTGVLLSGCSQRENPIMVTQPLVDTPFSVAMGSASLQYNQVGDPSTRILSVVWASEIAPSTTQAPFPVLYLLHDFEGDGEYYGRYKLQGIVEEMFRNGEIGRMLIVTIGAENSFGGSYYRNSVSSGQYADLIGEVVHVIEDVQFNGQVYTTQVGKAARAISGHGMGGYGAMRYAMENPGQFSSVSAMSAPLSFDADWAGVPWLERVTDRAFVESGVVDSTTYAAMAPNDPANAFTNRLFAMSAAFSPREMDPFEKIDTCRKCSDIFCSRILKIFPCSVFASVPAGVSTFEFPPDPNGGRANSEPTSPANVGVDLPVIWTKARLDSIWGFWQDNDAASYIRTNTNALSGMGVYLDCGVDDEFGYLYQNRDFASALSAAGYQENTDYFYEEYSGLPGVPAGHSDLIAERLRRIIKFHSDRLARVPKP